MMDRKSYMVFHSATLISWPPLKLQFQFDHTRRVVDARSRIDAITNRARRELAYVACLNGRERARAPGQVNEPGLGYNMNYTIIHISINKNDFQLQRTSFTIKAGRCHLFWGIPESALCIMDIAGDRCNSVQCATTTSTSLNCNSR